MLADTKSTRNRYNNMSDAPTPASNPRRLRRRTVWLGALVALLLLAGLGWLGWTYTRPGAMGDPQPASSATRFSTARWRGLSRSSLRR